MNIIYVIPFKKLNVNLLHTLSASSIHVTFLSSSSTPIDNTLVLQFNIMRCISEDILIVNFEAKFNCEILQYYHYNITISSNATAESTVTSAADLMLSI